MASESPFVHLHLHTDFSLLDGCARVDRLAARARELGMPAMAMTDHGNLFGVPSFQKALQKEGIKPLIGCEVYLVHDHLMSDRPKRDRKRSDDITDVPEDELGPDQFPAHQIHHKTLIAKNFRGYQNLAKLISGAHVDGFYYRPRTDMEQVAQYSEGIIGLSGCLNGVAAQYLIYNNYDKAREVIAQFRDIFGADDYYVEIMDHGLPVQRRVNRDLIRLAREFGLKLVCTNDVHYVLKGDSEPHDALLCIQTGKRVSDDERMRYPCQEFYLKGRAEMEALFQEVPEAVTNTLEVAEKVEFELHFGENHYPLFEQPIDLRYNRDEASFDRILDTYVEQKNEIQLREGADPITLSSAQRSEYKKNGLYLFDLCKRGLKERYGIDYDAVQDDPEGAGAASGEPIPPGHTARDLCVLMDYQLAIIMGAGFIDYFLIVWDFIDWARRQGIPVGPGRGSGVGSIVSYVLRITDVEPLRFGLVFERMLSLERVSPPDFDVDFCMRRRDVVVNYVREKYGHNRVANIITYGTFGAKAVVRDLARVLDLSYAEADRIAKMVPDDLNISLDDAVRKSAELQAEIKRNDTARQIFEQGKVIEGMVRNTGKHACGMIIGDRPITDLVPVTLQEGDLTTQFAKGPVEDLGLLKMDFLGLKTLTVIDDAQQNVRLTTRQAEFDVEDIPLDDEKTYALLNSGKTTGVFQLESGGMQNLCRRLGLSEFEEIIALIALYRPGPMQFIDQYIEGKKDPETIKLPHPLLKDITEETYGVLVYQEQVMQAAQVIAGYTLGGADILRRAMGKKVKSIMDAQKEVFVQGAAATNGIGKKMAEEIFAILEKFAQYGFNKAHSTAYAMLSYRTAFLKANYPTEFMAAVLSSELGNADKVSHFIEEAGSLGIHVLGPDVNESRHNFTPVVEEDGQNATTIRFGLAAIKGVGDSAAARIIEEREADGPYTSFRDFISRLDSKLVNRRVTECLIKTGAFDECGEDRRELLDNLDSALNEAASLQRDRERGQELLFDMFDADPAGSNGDGPDTDQDHGQGGEDRAANGSREADERAGVSLHEKLEWEKELLGFYVSGHPMNPYAEIARSIDSFHGDAYTRLDDRAAFRICGVITGLQKKVSRRDNQPWGIVALATRRNTYSINIYSRHFSKVAHLLEPGKLVIVCGSVSQRNGESQLVGDRVQKLEPAIPDLIQQVDWILHPDDRADDFLTRIREQIDRRFGETRVRIGFRIDDDHAVLAKTAGSLSWFLDAAEFRNLAKHEAVATTRLDAKAPPEPDLPEWARR